MAIFSDETIIEQIFSISGLNVLGQFVSFLGVIVYTQIAPQAVLGSYFLVVAVMSVISFFGSTGVSTDITRQINQSSDPGSEKMTAIVFSVIFSIAAFFAQPAINHYIGHQFGFSLVVLIPVSMFSRLTGAILRGEKKNTRAVALRTSQKGSTYLIGSLAIVSGVDPHIGLIGGLLCGKLLEFGVGVILIDLSPRGVPGKEELLKLAKRI
ncbi:MAG: hypothetical protein ABEI86_12910, partial [Halobacteriaceae archaeon]